jgi:hypothetical protein
MRLYLSGQALPAQPGLHGEPPKTVCGGTWTGDGKSKQVPVSKFGLLKNAPGQVYLWNIEAVAKLQFCNSKLLKMHVSSDFSPQALA